MNEHQNPWKTIGRKKVYENPWISLEEHQFFNPAGNEGIYGKLHFKNKAIGIIPLDEENNTWLVGQYRYPLDEYSWEIPMGGGPEEDDVLESAKRELKEETGLIANKWDNIMRIHTSNSVTDEEGFVFLARELIEGETEFEETEKLEIKRVPLKQAVEMVMDQKITDSISIAGILKVARILEL
mgnify:CR=1 FL=1